MPDSSASLQPDLPPRDGPGTRSASRHPERSGVIVLKHPVPWEDVDLSDLGSLTLRLIFALGSALQQGCHYLNPRYTVSSPGPSPAFYREVFRAGSSWLRMLRDNLGKHATRRLAESQTPSGRHATLSGLMFQDGKAIPTRTWHSLADQALHPEIALISVNRRRADLAEYKATRDPGPLKALSLAGLRSQLSLNPKAALYVTPAITVAAPTFSPAFLEKAHAAEREWHGRVYRILRRDKESLARAADPPTRLLVHHGALVIDGRCNLPGCWPDQRPSRPGIRPSPPGTSTVPLTFLGLAFPTGHPLEPDTNHRGSEATERPAVRSNTGSPSPSIIEEPRP